MLKSAVKGHAIPFNVTSQCLCSCSLIEPHHFYQTATLTPHPFSLVTLHHSHVSMETSTDRNVATDCPATTSDDTATTIIPTNTNRGRFARHSVAEKQYRERFNHQIENLREVLSEVITQDSGHDENHSVAQLSTKSSTLSAAVEVIQLMHRRLSEEMERGRILKLQLGITGDQVKCDDCPAVRSVSTKQINANT